MGRALVILVAAVVSLTSADARAAGLYVDFNAEVPGLAKRTWLGLVQQAVPDLKIDPSNRDHHATGEVKTPIRLMEGDQEAGGDKDTINLTSLDAAKIDIGGKPRWVVLGEQDVFGLAPLMLFEADGAGKLLDAVDVVADVHSSMDSAGPIAVGGGAALVGVRNWHDNTSGSHDDLKLVLIAKDRFSLIVDERAAGERLEREISGEGLTFSARPDPGRALAEVEVVLEHQTQRLAADGETKIGKAVVTKTKTTFRWNAAKGKYEKSGR